MLHVKSKKKQILWFCPTNYFERYDNIHYIGATFVWIRDAFIRHNLNGRQGNWRPARKFHSQETYLLSAVRRRSIKGQA
jgi:hypothetical protein